jgi:dTMP kinase
MVTGDEGGSRGRFVVLEGGEGSGKSRLLDALRERFASAGTAVEAYREPGSTALGERIRALVAAETALGDDLAELLLFEAARAHIVASEIRPALARGALVLCDRFTASSLAYQAYGRGLAREVIERANAIATGGLEPDLTLLLDLPVEAGLARRRGEGAQTHFDALPLEFHERVREGYLALARESPDRWRVLDATQPFDAVCDAAYAAIREVSSAR